MFKHLRFLPIILVAIYLSPAFAKAKAKKVAAKPAVKAVAPVVATKTAARAATPTPAPVGAKPFKVEYGSAPWNKDSKQLDQAYMFVHDKSSNRTVKILIEETEPDSSIFSGRFSIDFKHASDIEVFIPPENVRISENAVVKFNQLMNEKKVMPSPMVFKDDGNGFLLDVYDTNEQAKRARKVYEDQVKKEAEAERTKNIKPVPSEQALAAAQLAEKELAMALMAKQAAERETSRIRMEQLEAQRLEQMRREHDLMSAAQKQKKMDEAAKFAAQGNAFYDKTEFKSAEAAYAKSVELDPNNKETYFKYGVSLYRNEKMNEALVALKLAPSDPKTDLEKKYYNGLIHYRLNEYPAARSDFGAVKNAKTALSPSGGFYEGVVYFAERNYEDSQKSFEWVLDNSQDPALDKKADEFIEKIAAALAEQKEASRKWKVNASLAGIYDSNILYTPDSDSTTGTATNKGGLRTSLSGDVDYRFLYSSFNEFSVKASTLYMYSIDKDFKSADPFLNTLSMPYTFKGTLSQRGYKLTLTPGYEALYMDAEDTGSRKNILNTMYGNADITVIMRDNWFANYSLDVRQDKFHLTSSSGANKMDALKYTLKTQHIHLIDDAKKQAVILQADVVLNDATGKNKTYNRLDLGVIYSAPWKKYKDTTWNTGLMLYKQNYTDDDSRADTDMAFILGMTKNIDERWNWGVNGNYTNNASTVSDNQYSKYSVTTNLNYSWQN